MTSWIPLLAGIICACASSVICHPTVGAHCNELAHLQLVNRRINGSRFISVHGQLLSLSVYWSDEVSRAAAALLLVALRHQLHYTDLQLEQGPRDLCLLDNVIRSRDDSRLALVPSAAWDWRKPCRGPCDPLQDGFCVLGGAELVVMQTPATPLAVRAHVHLAAGARARVGCARAASWQFYHNLTAIESCSFEVGGDFSSVTMYVVMESAREVPEARGLLERAAGARVPLRLEPLSRSQLADMLRHDAARSFLFLDWELWQQHPRVEAMEAPPCAGACSTHDCAPHPQAVPVRAASQPLFMFARPLFLLSQTFSPEPYELREILEMVAHDTHRDIEETACLWATKHKKRVSKWLHGTGRFDYTVLVFVCKEDADDYSVVDTVINLVGHKLWLATNTSNFGVSIHLENVSCSNRSDVLRELDSTTRKNLYYRTVGIVAAKEGADALVEPTVARNLQLVAYDLNTVAVHGAVGHAGHITAVLHQFFSDNKWTRIAFLSERTKPAAELVNEFNTIKYESLCVRNEQVTTADAGDALRTLKRLDGRVVVLNMRAERAARAVAAAAALGMTPAAGWVWVAREWPAAPPASPMRVFVVSGECRGARNGSHASLRAEFDREFGSTWPPRASAVADALLTLGHGLLEFMHLHPQYKDDLHGDHSLRLFWNKLTAANVQGLCQHLRYEGNQLAEPLVYIDEWDHRARQLVSVWSVSGDRARPLHRHRHDFQRAPSPADRSSTCYTPAGDCYTPECHDVKLAIGLISLVLVLILVPIAALRVRRELRRREQRKEDEIQIKLMARREQIVFMLAEYIVQRDQLELQHELGSGHSGHVHFALLRTPSRKLRAVAVKMLRDTAAPSEAGEFLREASMLAALDHNHVVRLVGVCTGDPMLLLMEHAFFGDLLGYLRSRRHLAEGFETETNVTDDHVGPEEAAHVSAEALTRLMREAASALAYLAHRGIAHRDVRAANCLVDAHRSLKLADFGMARETRKAGADGRAEYACRRRGMFPVMWMAPESLNRGAFSAASDVWSLGVLVLEVVTLGARPYGSWPSLRVLEYVSRGGRPSLPLDATAQTRGVALACWRHAARERPAAAEVVAYLADHPRALRPALAPPAPDLDSEYGEPDRDATDSLDPPSPDSCTPFFQD